MSHSTTRSIYYLITASLCVLLFIPLGGCGCGFDCNNGNNNDNQPGVLTLGFSDALPEDLKQVVIEVDSITLTRSGRDDIVIERFTIDELDAVDAESFQMDLLDYRGRRQLRVITDLELDATSYNRVEIGIAGGDINRSFVQEADDNRKPIAVASAGLAIPGMTLGSGDQAFTVEFGLAQSLRERPASGDYLLTSNGVRIEDNATAATVSGRVATTLFDTVSPCDEKTDPESGNRIYIYRGHGFSDQQLSDVFTDASSTPIPDDAVAPFAVAALVDVASTATWQYVFGFLPAGDYTMAFSCNTASDDPIDFDNIDVPLPDGQVYELSLEEAQSALCDLGDNADCRNF